MGAAGRLAYHTKCTKATRWVGITPTKSCEPDFESSRLFSGSGSEGADQGLELNGKPNLVPRDARGRALFAVWGACLELRLLPAL